MTYGYKIQENDDYFVNVVDKAIANFALATSPGTFLMDIIPILGYLPKWSPGLRRYWELVATWRRETFRMELADALQMEMGIATAFCVSVCLMPTN